MYGNQIYYAAIPIPCKSVSTIEVLGEGTVAAAPDRALVILGAITEGKELQSVQSENTQITTDIIQALLDLGIPREHIQTNDYRIEMVYDYPDGKQVFQGYKLTHLLQITIDQVDQTGYVVDTAVSHGANTVSSIQFSIKERKRFEIEALSLAVQNARLKATAISNSLGTSISRVPIKVQELSRSSEPIPVQRTFQSDALVTPIEPGQLTIYAAVRVWYSQIT
ncbi:SIMPL domain-containing protein [Bacillus sp. FJAT-28004]|uniref:SIMPL domain-containing protein n=1 Tax=Bacillus sp. FJAT-28004 TaxID=1679165 RepID=UPI0006B4DAD6|nr:SIMPL domain-containing protein [Bacillus sp. FJAT-28004]